MNNRALWLLYRMLKATIMTIGNVPGDHQKIFADAEKQFIEHMHHNGYSVGRYPE